MSAGYLENQWNYVELSAEDQILRASELTWVLHLELEPTNRSL